MKIIYITNARLPTEKAHGLQIMKSCEAFAKTGIDLTLIVPFRVNPLKGDPFDYYGVKKNFKLRRIFSLDFFWLEWFPKKLAFFIQAVSFAFLASLAAPFYKNKETIFYSRDWATLFFLCLFGLKPVAEIHDYRSQKPKRPIRFILNRCRNLIVNSEGTKNLLEDHYKITKEILVVPNGVDADFFDIKETKEEARKILGIPLDKKIVAYVGSLETVGMEKGVGYLLQAFSLLKERKGCILYIVGGPNKLAEEYRKKLPEFGLGEDNVVLTGYVEYKKIPLYLRAFDILVIPLPKIQHSITTSPIKVFEYMAAGKAIIASDLPSLRAYLDENNVLFFEPESYQDLSRKIQLLLDGDILRKKLSENVKILAQKYSWLERTKKILLMLLV